MTANRNKYQNNSKKQTRRRKKRRQIFHRHLEETEHVIYKQEQLYIYVLLLSLISCTFCLFSLGGSEFVLVWCGSEQYNSANVCVSGRKNKQNELFSEQPAVV